MHKHWQIKKSLFARVLISCLASIPIGLSIVLQQDVIIQISLVILTIFLLNSLFRNINSVYSDEDNILSWRDGSWAFYNRNLSVEGLINNKSFSLGVIMFLSISDPLNKNLELWIFPDSFNDNPEGWRHLQCCFYLSKKVK